MDARVFVTEKITASSFAAAPELIEYIVPRTVNTFSAMLGLQTWEVCILTTSKREIIYPDGLVPTRAVDAFDAGDAGTYCDFLEFDREEFRLTIECRVAVE